MVKINYPKDCTTDAQKFEFLVIIQEKLRLQHNEIGKDYTDGKITKEEWNNYLNDFDYKNNGISFLLLSLKEKFKKSDTFKIDLDNFLTY